MKNTKQIQKEVRELIKPQMIEGHYDPILINRCVEATLKAIDYVHSSLQLKEKYKKDFEEFITENFKKEDSIIYRYKKDKRLYYRDEIWLIYGKGMLDL